MKSLGVAADKEALRARSRSRKRGRSETRDSTDVMDIDRSTSRGPRARSITRDRSVLGLRDDTVCFSSFICRFVFVVTLSCSVTETEAVVWLN